MITRELLLFEKPGPENTQATLEAARRRAASSGQRCGPDRAEEVGTRHAALATSTGETLLKALDAFEGTDVKLVGVTLLAGYWEVYEPPDEQKIEAARSRGAKVLTATHALMGTVETAIREKFGGLPPVELVARTCAVEPGRS